MLDVGQRCSAPHCNTIDFLPTRCPDCSQAWCSSHLHSDSHGCFQASDTRTASGSSFAPSARCQVAGCENVTMEAAGLHKTREDADAIGKAVRCPGCAGAFCVRCVRCRLI